VGPISILPLAPSKGDIPDLSFKDKQKMRLALTAPTKYGRKPRLATGRELMDATKRISASISKFDAPFIVIHGLEDHVTSPSESERLHKESPSKDKTIKLYKGMCQRFGWFVSFLRPWQVHTHLLFSNILKGCITILLVARRMKILKLFLMMQFLGQ